MKLFKKKPSPLLISFASGLFAALLIFLWILQIQPREKTLFLYTVLPSPDAFYRETLLEAGEVPLFSDGLAEEEKGIGTIRFTFIDPETQAKYEVIVDPEPYNLFYMEIQGDRGVKQPGKEVETLFKDGKTAVLSFFMRNEGVQSDEKQPKPFQRLEILPKKGWYRVRRVGGFCCGEWVYFHHLGIDCLALKLFGKR